MDNAFFGFHLIIDQEQCAWLFAGVLYAWGMDLAKLHLSNLIFEVWFCTKNPQWVVCSFKISVFCWNRRIFQGNSMNFHGFLCDSMPTPFVGSRRFLLYDHEGLFVSCFQKILCFYHVYNEPESPVIRESTHFHRLHQQVMSPVSNKAPRYAF